MVFTEKNDDLQISFPSSDESSEVYVEYFFFFWDIFDILKLFQQVIFEKVEKPWQI